MSKENNLNVTLVFSDGFLESAYANVCNISALLEVIDLDTQSSEELLQLQYAMAKPLAPPEKDGDKLSCTCRAIIKGGTLADFIAPQGIAVTCNIIDIDDEEERHDEAEEDLKDLEEDCRNGIVTQIF